MGMGRKILRFGPSIAFLRTFIVNLQTLAKGQQKEPTHIFVLRTLSALWLAGYFWLDHYLWLFRVSSIITLDGHRQKLVPKDQMRILQRFELASGHHHRPNQKSLPLFQPSTLQFYFRTAKAKAKNLNHLSSILPDCLSIYLLPFLSLTLELYLLSLLEFSDRLLRLSLCTSYGLDHLSSINLLSSKRQHQHLNEQKHPQKHQILTFERTFLDL